MFLKKTFCLEMDGVSVDQVDAVVEEIFFEKKVAAILHGNFVIKQHCHGWEVVFFGQMFVILLLISL